MPPTVFSAPSVWDPGLHDNCDSQAATGDTVELFSDTIMQGWAEVFMRDLECNCFKTNRK